MSLMSTSWWKRLFGGVLAAILLAPVPALGLTFLGPWSFFQSQLNFPPILTSFGDSSRGGFLQLDFGFNQDSTFAPGISTIVATRNFRTANPSEALTVVNSLPTLQFGGNLSVNVQIRNLSAGDFGTDTTILSVTERAGWRFARLPHNIDGTVSNVVNLPGPADYRVTVFVRYLKNRFGSLDNLAPPVPASAFVITFTGP